MNDIFKLFKKRAQAGKSTNLTDVIQDLNEKEKNEIMGTDGVGKFERGSKSYLSISKSGRLKSKKSQSSRALGDDLFNPISTKLSEIACRENNNLLNNNNNNCSNSHNGISRNPIKKPVYDPHPNMRTYDQNSDNADSSRTSSTSSSFRSSIEEIAHSHHSSEAYNPIPQAPKKQAPIMTNNYNSNSTLSNRPVAVNYNLQSANNTRSNMITTTPGLRNNMRYGEARNQLNSSSNHSSNNSNNLNMAFKRF
jgi:hypothetical protein